MTDEQPTTETETNVLPSDLTELSQEELDSALAAAREEAADLQGIEPADMTDAQLTRLEALADFVDSVAVDQERRATEQAERTARAEAAAERLSGGDDDGEPAEGDEDSDEDGDDEGDEPPAEAPAPPAESIAAAGNPAKRIAKARKNPAPVAAEKPFTTMVASADVGGRFSASQELESYADLTEAFIQRSKSFKGQPSNRQQFGVAVIERNFANTADGLFVGNPDFQTVQQIMETAAKESRLSGGSLVAAGGWCAPSETRYGLSAPETLDGILDLPTTGVPRGGINYTPGPDFADIYTTAGFALTEAQVIAGDDKTCIEVDCPDFSEVRLDAVGICVTAPLLTRSAYPEVIQRWLEGTIVANQHKVNARLIAAMRTALGTALAPVLTGTPITWSMLTALELVGEGQRQAYRLGEGQTLEVVAPRWLKIAVRADLANRNGIDERSVSDAQIAQHFADRGLRIQWVLGYLELATPTTNIAFPASAEVMVYPAGTFVKGVQDVVSLDTVYDNAMLKENMYTAAFVEDGVLLAKMQHGGKRITLPVNVNGMLGAAQLDDNWGTAQAETAGAAAA